MKNKFSQLQLLQMDEKFDKLRHSTAPSRPPNGWVKAIRESLGMSASALARRLGVTPHSISKLEKAEAQERITLASLRKLAEALNCELQYSLVPRKSLEDLLKDRAIEVARSRLDPIAHSMSLENQQLDAVASEKQLQLLAVEILNGSKRNLW